jgi:hypothetical protein
MMTRCRGALCALLLAACGPGVEEGPLPAPFSDGSPDSRREVDGRIDSAGPCICDNNYNHYQAHRLYTCNPPLNTKLCAAGSNEELPGLLNLYDRNCLRELTPGYFKKC